MAPTRLSAQTPRARGQRRRWLLLAALLLAAAGVWALAANLGAAQRSPAPVPLPAPLAAITPGAVARMDSPALVYSPGWRVDATGADPAEPANPALMPSGVFTFTYIGGELALNLALGNYWGYLYVTVDGAPANLLPPSRWQDPAPALRSGYRPLLAPELAQADGAPAATWVRVHRARGAAAAQVHTARVEVWRSWGQTPVRALAVDALPPRAAVRWPGVLLLLAALWCAALPALEGLRWLRARLHARRLQGRQVALAQRALGSRAQRAAPALAGLGVALLALAVWRGAWIVGLGGLALLGLAGIVRPALWYSALLFGLPFYYRFALPLLPGRALNLVDTGVWLGLMVALAHTLLAFWAGARPRARFAPGAALALALLASWALVATFAAQHFGVALREWRTVFLMAVLLAAGLALTLRAGAAHSVSAEVGVMVGGWLLGAALMATAALLLYPNPAVIIPAEGVNRLRAFYGSPNNLALYLERTLAVTLALALLRTDWRARAACALLALPQAAAWLLTFSRAGLFVALPVMLITLWLGGLTLLRRARRPTRVLWIIAGIMTAAAVALMPFAGSARLANLLSTAQGTGFLRINLWRSAWQMGIDHPLLGVGPDNFLYAYRSQYILPQAWMESNLNHPHTWLLDWWTRLGLPGLALGLGFWLLVVYGLAVRVGAPAPAGARAQWPALYAGLMAAALAALAHGLLDLSYALPDLMAVWALLAVLATLRSPQSLPPA